MYIIGFHGFSINEVVPVAVGRFDFRRLPGSVIEPKLSIAYNKKSLIPERTLRTCVAGFRREKNARGARGRRERNPRSFPPCAPSRFALLTLFSFPFKRLPRMLVCTVTLTRRQPQPTPPRDRQIDR